MESKKATIFKNISTPLIVLVTVIIFGITGCGDGGGSTGPGDDPEQPQGDKTIAQVVEEDSSLGTFNQFVSDAGVSKLEEDGPYTLLAPTDSAFNTLPDGFADGLSSDEKATIVNYHILADAMFRSDIAESSVLSSELGDSIFVKEEGDIEFNHNAAISEADIEASNGVIHKIDHVLVPDQFLTVFGVLHKRYELSKFACHCTSGRTDLEEVLRQEDNTYTVFVPTDSAFEEFGNVDDMSDAELKQIMDYHVIEGEKLLSGDLSDGQTLTTRQGAELTVSVSDGTITLTGVNGDESVVQKADIEGSNGVIYIMDTVLDPRSSGGM